MVEAFSMHEIMEVTPPNIYIYISLPLKVRDSKYLSCVYRPENTSYSKYIARHLKIPASLLRQEAGEERETDATALGIVTSGPSNG